MTPSSPWRSPVVLVWSALLLAFFIANGIFIYLAQTHNPGLVVEDYYERGQDYEKNMLKRLAADPGWQMRIEPPVQLVAQQPAQFRFYLSDSQGQLLVPDRVELYAYRPVDAADDFHQPMSQLSSGVYQAMVSFPLPGSWDLLAVVTQDGAEHSAALRVQVGKANSQ
jgi:nitrogen fixation protein FixH